MGKILVVGFAGIEDPKGMERVEMNRVLLRQAQIIGYVCIFLLSIPLFYSSISSSPSLSIPSPRARMWKC